MKNAAGELPTAKTLSIDLGMPYQTTFEHVNALGVGHRLKGGDMGLVERIEDPADRRNMLLSVTTAGRAVMDTLSRRVRAFRGRAQE